ncbi:hypothetical protein [Mycobacterium kansasii]|nr:hypothetical protein [Mycobacterium kansasii]EUA20806.1 hypothetical protein I545_0036 [Mycobacterium kansasii 662]KEP43916.1 hypothetical protein MKSMC1_09920 [Mycobacterium kansasii]MXO36487.1 hypothetical protein [Mycobacterium kansasii]VAZ58865.1 hypothetical protein LAUMK22_00657 [Mycobacterium kansasii]VAZ65260.1 hypothetical protein LAUMK40_01385 [Mycobacterium kansasii]
MGAGTRSTDSSVIDGMDTLCASYLELQPDDRVLVLYSDELHGDDDQRLLETLRQRIREGSADVRVEPADRFDGHRVGAFEVLLLVSMVSSIHRAAVLQYLQATEKPKHTRIFRLFNFSPALFSLPLAVDRASLDSLNNSVIAAAKRTHDIRVTNPAGTDVYIRPLPDGGWTNSCGYFNGRFPAILPPGEVNTYTPHVTGIVVVDGAINSSFGFPGDPRLARNPVTLEITDSVVQKAGCSDPVVSGVLSNFFEVENADRVGEVGFGTNEGITDWVGFLSHINERHPGLHLGLGTPTQPRTKVGWTAPLHLDMILDGCSIWFDEVLVFSDGRWDRVALDSQSQGHTVGEVLHIDAV